MPLHVTNVVGRDFRGRASILEYVTALSALTFSLINSTRPHQAGESRVCGYRPEYSPHLGIHKGHGRLYISRRTSAFRARIIYQERSYSMRCMYTRMTPVTDNSNSVDRCLLDARSQRRKRVESVIIPRLRSPFAGGRLSIGWIFFLFLFGVTD